MPPLRERGRERPLSPIRGEARRETPPRYFIASALGGDPTPPGILSGAEVKKNS